jgi:hypothetical protein
MVPGQVIVCCVLAVAELLLGVQVGTVLVHGLAPC